MRVHHLTNNRATIISLIPHSLRFSDGSVSEPQDEEIVKMFTLARESENVHIIAGMNVNSTRMVLSRDQLVRLNEIRGDTDLVLVPFPMLVALREQGVRDMFPNVVAFNATVETQRSPPDEEIVDVENWSY